MSTLLASVVTVFPVLFHFRLAVLSVIGMAADTIRDLVGPDPEFPLSSNHYRHFYTRPKRIRFTGVARSYLVLLVIRFIPLQPCLGVLPSLDPPPDPSFMCANGIPLSTSIVNVWLSSILKAADVLGNYSSFPATAFGLVQLLPPSCHQLFSVSGPVIAVCDRPLITDGILQAARHIA